MEGVVAEAASLAGHLKLGKLIYLYDSNQISLDGSTDLTFSTEDVNSRFKSYGWQVITVENGDTDLEAIHEAIESAKAETLRPTLIHVKTTIGFGSPKAGTSAVHGNPIVGEDLEATKKSLGCDLEPFSVSQETRNAFLERTDHLQAYEEWQARWKNSPKAQKLWDRLSTGELPQGWADSLPEFGTEKALATRSSAGQALNELCQHLPELFGGDADLSCSTNTGIKNETSFEGQNGTGRNIHYGVREHAMGAIANGIAYHGGLRTFTATFFCFSDYMRGSLRLAAMNHLPVVHVWTHDSIGVGEDGPTHQPVEHLMSLRTMPGLNLIRPADANESVAAWKVALQTKDAPTGLVLTRQALPVLTSKEQAKGLEKGAYTLKKEEDSKPLEVLLMASGSEVQIAVEVGEQLNAEGINTRVVSFPSFELFEKQSDSYKDEVLPPSNLRVSIEAGATFGWERYVGRDGMLFGIDRYGISAPGGQVFQFFELRADVIKAKIKNRVTNQ